MIVLVTNLTDAPTHPKGPIQVDIYNKTLDPGTSLKLPADLLTKSIRSLEKAGLISIGNLPPWYVAAKKRTGRALTEEEKKLRQLVPPPPTPVIQLKPVKEVKEKVAEPEEALSRKNKG